VIVWTAAATVITTVAALLFAAWYFDHVAVTLSMNGWIALSLGVSLTAMVSAGLMLLVFASARGGHDDLPANGLMRDDSDPPS
jgi:uncharacterized integral membrane protein